MGQGESLAQCQRCAAEGSGLQPRRDRRIRWSKSYAFASSTEVWFVAKNETQSAARALHDMSQKVRETHRLEELAAAVRANDPFPTGTVFLRSHGILCGPDASAKCSFEFAHKKKAPLTGA